jgi:prepilin-type N-terminal cleavage/methylation domain-containing protein
LLHSADIPAGYLMAWPQRLDACEPLTHSTDAIKRIVRQSASDLHFPRALTGDPPRTSAIHYPGYVASGDTPMPRLKKGFTLIELLIVVVIIGILAAIAIPKFANTKEKSYVASMKSDLHNLITAQEAYFADNNNLYAQSTTNLGTNYKASSGITVTLSNVTVSGWSAIATSLNTAKTCQVTLSSMSTADGTPICQ